jgi:hypothetical protein
MKIQRRYASDQRNQKSARQQELRDLLNRYAATGGDR